MPTPTLTPTPTIPPKFGWTLTFDDEFYGNRIDTDKWNTLPRPDCVINNESQAYVFDALRVANGLLSIEVEKRRATYGNFCPEGKKEMIYTSGLVSTWGKFSQTYGWFEMRAKLPRAQGPWPSFWLLPETPIGPGGTYTPAAEVDIMEHVTGLGNKIFAGLHWNGYSKDHQLWGSPIEIPGLLDEFHTFALEWQPGTLIWYADGKMIQEHTAPAVPSVPLYVNVALPLDGTFGGPVNDAQLPDSFQIDYVRVYRKN